MRRLYVIPTLVGCAVLAALATANAKEWKTGRIGTEGYVPPFNSFDTTGQPKGFDIDISNELCQKMHVECVFVARDRDGIIPGPLSNKYAAIIASMSITDEHKTKVEISERHDKTPVWFYGPKGAGVTDTSPQGLAGKVIGALSATTQAGFLEDNYKESDVRLYATQDEVHLDLASGRLDLVLGDSVPAMEWMKTADGQCCEQIGSALYDRALAGDGAGIAIRNADQDLKAKFNKALSEMLSDGTYKQLNDQYFDFDVYGSE